MDDHFRTSPAQTFLRSLVLVTLLLSAGAAAASACDSPVDRPPASPSGQDRPAALTSADCWIASGAALRSQGHWEEARVEFDHAAALLLPHDSTYARTWNELGGVYRALGRPREAEAAYRRALAALDAARAAEIPALQVNLGQALEQQGRGQEALALYRHAVAAWEQDVAEEKAPQAHAPALSAALTDLARLYQSRRDYSRAEMLLARALALDESAFTPDSLRIAMDWSNAAALAAARKRFSEAERMLRRSLEIVERQLPPEHPERCAVLANLAEVLYAQKRFAEAEALFKASLDVLERAWGPLNPSLAGWLEHYAAVLHWNKDYAEAERTRLRATRIRVHNTLRSE